MVSYLLSAKVYPEYKLNPESKKRPFPMNRSVPSPEETDTKIVSTFFGDQMLCNQMEVSLE